MRIVSSTKAARIVPLLLSACIALSLSACGSGSDSGSSTITPTLTGSVPSPTPAASSPAASPAASASTTAPASATSTTVADHAVTGLVSAVRLINANSGWLAGESGWIARTDDGGNKWKLQYDGKEPIQQLFALNEKQAWAVIQIPATDSRMSPLLVTKDGGAHWQSAGGVPPGNFVHFVSATEGFSGNNYTTDGGRTWSAFKVPEGVVGSSYFHDREHGWAVTSEKDAFLIHATVDGGHTWKTVMKKSSTDPINDAVIRSAGKNDAWVEVVGGSGMNQTSYSLFHTTDGGVSWTTVLANETAGGGPAPGIPTGNGGAGTKTKAASNSGSKPGVLYVIDTKNAYMGGYCPPCEKKENTVGKTSDGGRTWINGESSIPGASGALLGFSDAKNGWWISQSQGQDSKGSSVLYRTSDGGNTWKKIHSF